MGDTIHLFRPYNLADTVGALELVAGVLLTIGSLVFIRLMRRDKIPKD